MGFGPILQGAGAASSAIGAYYSAKQQRTALKMQADMAEINARSAETTAQSAMRSGEKEVGRLTLQAGQLKSRQRATMAANGVDLGAGSASELLASTDIMKEIDKNAIEENATRTAWGYRVQGTNFSNEALMKRATASGIDPNLAAVSSLLGSASQVASSWYSLAKAKG